MAVWVPGQLLKRAVKLGVRFASAFTYSDDNSRQTNTIVSIISMVKTRQIPADDDDTPRKRRGRKLCNHHEGCTNFILQGGVCRRHGAVIKRCSSEGCTNQAQNGGVCIRHGAKKTHKFCSHAGCTKYAQKRGFCCRHGGKYKCRFEGCSNQVVNGGVCWSHGAKKRNERRMPTPAMMTTPPRTGITKQCITYWKAAAAAELAYWILAIPRDCLCLIY